MKGVVIKVDGEPAVIVDASGNPVTLEDENGDTTESGPDNGSDSGTQNGEEETSSRLYVLSSDPVLFQKTILNMRITDFRFRKVSRDGSGLPGAVFQLKAIKNDAEVLVTEDTDYEDIVGVEETVEIDVDGETKTFNSAFITTGEEQIISRLRDGTYILEEVYVPTGYITSLGKIRFVISRGIMRMDMETPLPDDIVFILGRQTVNDPTLAFLTVKNSTGAPLPNTGGSGTGMIYVLGFMLISFAGACLLIISKGRRKAV